MIARQASLGSNQQPSTASSWVKVAVGALLVALAAREWRGRHDRHEPGWVFTVVGVSTVVGPVIAYAVATNWARPRLTRLRGWLETNNSGIMAAVFVIIGAVLVGKGIAGLT